MRDADRSLGSLGPMAARPEGEPHLTFEILLADTLHEMTQDESRPLPLADEATELCDDAVASFRTSGTPPLVRPFHHAYLTPMHSPAIAIPHPPRLDVRS
jgi:hypothetical protein